MVSTHNEVVGTLVDSRGSARGNGEDRNETTIWAKEGSKKKKKKKRQIRKRHNGMSSLKLENCTNWKRI